MTAPDKGTPLTIAERLRGPVVVFFGSNEWFRQEKSPFLCEAADRIEALEREALRLAGELAYMQAMRESDWKASQDHIRELREKFALMRDGYETQIKALTDPIVRAKMLEPSPPIILESALASREGWQLVP